jgi:SAM-dependent methyltransferase
MTPVAQAYGRAFSEYGCTPQGLLWKDRKTADKAYDVLLEILQGERASYSVLDFGCGYGPLIPRLWQIGELRQYSGVEINQTIREKARELYEGYGGYEFVEEIPNREFDYCFASGPFNVKMTTPYDEWGEWVLATVRRLGELCKRGAVVNFITWKPDWRREDLWYPDSPEQITSMWSDLGQTEVVEGYGIYQFSVFLRRI